nr:glycoprotein hormone alpha 2 [Schistocerca gregaria]
MVPPSSRSALHFFALAVALCLSAVSAGMDGERDAWEKPGCHRVGHTRKISIPDCIEFPITTNACRGFCESWSVPSALNTLRVNPHQAITSIGQCCNIMETEDVEVRVMCLDGPRDLVFKSAKSCQCYHCKKD